MEEYNDKKAVLKSKALIFYTYLPPWRIDVFNKMGELYDLKIVFLNPYASGFIYNRSVLLRKLAVKHSFGVKRVKLGKRVIPLGLYSMIRDFNPSVVFSHEFSFASLFCALIKKCWGVRFKFIVTTSDNADLAKRSGIFRRLAQRIVLSEAAGLVVYGESVKEIYQKGFLKLNIGVCPNIQNPKELLSHKSKFGDLRKEFIHRFGLENSGVILFVGRFESVKGLELLIRAFSRSEYENYKLVLVGKGSLQDSLVKEANELGMNKYVVFPGFFSDTSLYVWYDIANFLVLPSLHEPFGAVVNEALVYGCPVLVSRHCGATQFVESNESGKIFDPTNEQEFVESLNSSMRLYRNFNLERRNLMTCSFEESVKVFEQI